MKHRGFTLIELLVVIAIIGLLSTIAVVAMSTTGRSARNQQRKSNLVQISKALELYYDNNGSYPDTGSVWRGTCAGFDSSPDVDPVDYPTNSSWIPGLTAGGYLARLPHDPSTGRAVSDAALCRANPSWSCYVYKSDGTDYKAAAYCLPEGTMSASDPFYDPVESTFRWAVYSPGGRNF